MRETAHETLADPAFALYGTLSDAIVVLGSDEFPVYANPASMRLFEVADFDTFLRRWDEIRGPLDNQLRDQGADSRIAEVPLRFRGRRKILTLEARRLESVGCSSWVVVARDQMALDALYRDLQLAAQSRALSMIYKVLLHDAKAPLNAIVLNLDMLRETVLVPAEDDQEFQERQLRYLDTVRRELGRVNRSLKGVLSRAGSTSDSTRNFDIRRLLRELTTLVRPMARSQSVKVTTELPSEPVRIFGPRDRIKQALLNVIINGLESMPRGGLLTISLERDTHNAHIVITDTGVGIPRELLTQVFEMNFTTKRQGSGIGLYVARAVFVSQEGEIRLESTRGSGTVAHVRLPLPLTQAQPGA